MNACRSLGRSFCILHFNLFTCLAPCFGTESVIAGALAAVKMQRALVACALVAREIDRRPESMMMPTAFFSHPQKLQQLQLSLSCAVSRESELMRERERESGPLRAHPLFTLTACFQLQLLRQHCSGLLQDPRFNVPHEPALQSLPESATVCERVCVCVRASVPVCEC